MKSTMFRRLGRLDSSSGGYMRGCYLKAVAALVFACALASAACQTPTAPSASAANQSVRLGTLGPSQSPFAAEDVGQSPQDLEARGWTCRPSPVNPIRVTCSHPNQLHPAQLPGPPPPPDRPASISLLVFDNGAFVGTDMLIRSDLYNGQPCRSTGGDYRFIARIGYYECLHLH
jgi:hypothetical protein